MLGTLTREQSEHVLRTELIGRIGCYSGGKVYIVPVSYVFVNGYIYAHSNEGLKIRMMRKNTKVCFEVESRERWGVGDQSFCGENMKSLRPCRNNGRRWKYCMTGSFLIPLANRWLLHLMLILHVRLKRPGNQYFIAYLLRKFQEDLRNSSVA